MISTHTHTQVIKRSDGRDIVAKAAYNSRSDLTNLNTGKKTYNQARGKIVYETVLIPENSPNWLLQGVKDRAAFWSAVDKREIRKDAQLARELDVALLHELSVQENIDLLLSCVRRQFVERGMVADIAIHEPPKEGDPRNIHAHILVTMREITPDGFGNKVREWNHRSLVKEWRETFCNEGNRYLERNGFEPRLDHRSFKDRKIDKEPTRYKAPAAYRKTKQKRKGRDVPKGPLDVWKLLRETLDQKPEGRDSKDKAHGHGYEHEK